MMILPAKIVSFNQQRWRCLTGFQMGAQQNIARALPEHCGDSIIIIFVQKMQDIWGRHLGVKFSGPQLVK